MSWDTALADIGAPAARRARPPRRRGDRLVHGQPGRVLALAPAVGEGLPRRARLAPLLHAGSQDVDNRFAAARSCTGRRPSSRSPTSSARVPAHARRQPAGLARQRPHRAAHQGPAHDIVERGGRVVVVDPRRSETARAFEHVAVRPDTDAWLLLSLLHVIFEEGLADGRRWSGSPPATAAAGGLGRRTRPRPRRSAPVSPAETARALARDLAAADGAAVYGRTGSCLGRFGTLVAFLLDALNVVTGNLDAPGGAVFGRPAIALDDVGRAGRPRHLRHRRARASAASPTCSATCRRR